MKQRLLLSLLMLFVSVGFAVGQTYIIDVTFPANATKDITVNATNIAKDGAYYAQQMGDVSAEYIMPKNGVITIPAKDNSGKTFRITAAGATNYTLGGEIQKLLVNHLTVENITASSVKLAEVEIHAATALTTLNVSKNNLKTINVTTATALETLNISENPEFASFSGGLPQTLTSLDMHGNNLKIVDKAWDLSGLTELVYLNVDGNQLFDVKVPKDMPESGFIKGTQDWTFQNTLKVKANARTNVREIGEKYGLSLNFRGASWTKNNGQPAPEAHSVGTGADNTVTYCFYGDGNIYLAEETSYECVLEGENGFKYKVIVTVEPAVFNLKYEDPEHGSFVIKKKGQGNLDDNLTVAQGDELSISAKFENPGEENYTFGGLTKHEGLALSNGGSWESDPVSCIVQGKYKSPSEDEVPFIAANIIGKDVKITFNEPSNQQDGGTMRILRLNEDGTETVISGGSATLPYGTVVKIELTPADGYEAALLINGEEKETTNSGEGKWVLENYKVESDCEITATFKEGEYVELKALVNGKALDADEIGKIDLLQGDLTETLSENGNTKVWVRKGEVCQMSFNVGKAASVTEVKVGKTKIESTKIEPDDNSITYYYTFKPEVDAVIYITLNTLKTPEVTFKATQTVIYDGTAKAFKYTVEPELSGIKVTYKSENDATPIEKPINVGVYTVTITREADTQYSEINKTGELIIKQATPVITTLPNVSISEDGTEYVLTDDGVANTAGEFKVTEPVTPKTDAAHEVTVAFIPKDDVNYKTAYAKVEVVPEGCEALPKRAVSIETPYPSGIKSVRLMNGAAEVKSGEKFTDNTGLLVLVTYEEGIYPNAITLVSSLGSGTHKDSPEHSDASACVKAFIYVVDLERSGEQGDLLSVKVDDELKYDYVFKLKEQKNDYTGNVIEYLKDNIEIAKDPDDKSSSFTEPDFTVTYKGVDGLPVNAGKYVVCISIKAGAVKGYKAVDKKEFEGYFEIEKVYPEVDWPTATQISLGQTLKYARLVGGGSQNTSGHFEWTDNSVVPENGKSYPVKFIPDNKNYEEATTDLDERVKVTVINQRLVTYYANYGMDIKVTDATGKVYESGSPVEKGTVLTFTVAEPDEDLVLAKTDVKGAESWNSTQCIVGDKSIEIEFTFEPKTTEVIDPNSQYKVTVTESVRGAIISHPGENVVKRGESFTFTVSTLAADASKVVVKVDGTTLKPTNGKYVIQDVKKNTTVTVSLPNPTPLKVEVQKDYLNANKYHIGQVEIIDGEATSYYYGDVITVMADPEDGVKFVKWSDGSTDKIHEITLKADTKVVASFSGVPTGIEDIESAAITTGKGFIMVKNVANAKVTVVSISGRLQAQEEVSGDTRIDVPQGIYVVVLESGSDVKRTKVIVK